MQIDLIHCAAASQTMLFDRGVRVPEAQYKESFRRIHDNLTQALHTLTWGLPVHLMRPPTCTQLAHRPHRAPDALTYSEGHIRRRPRTRGEDQESARTGTGRVDTLDSVDSV
jgi:hypothetical protein